MEGFGEQTRNTEDIASFVKNQNCGFTTIREMLAKKPSGF